MSHLAKQKERHENCRVPKAAERRQILPAHHPQAAGEALGCSPRRELRVSLRESVAEATRHWRTQEAA